MNEFTVRLDLAKGKARQQQTVFVRQGDKNATTIVATITDHGAAAATSGLTTRFQMRLPDGTHYYRKAASLSGNVATVALDEAQAASVAGRTDVAYFQLLQGSTVVASTESFTVVVLPDALADAEVAESYDSAIQDAIDALDDAVEQMPDMVEDVLADHPEWTTTVQDGSITKDKLATDLARDRERLLYSLANLLTAQLPEGEIVTASDAAKTPMAGLALYGRSTQDGTPTPSAPVPIVSVAGANLYQTVASQTISGVTFTANADGSVTLNGTATATINQETAFTVPETGTYRLSGCPSGGSGSTYQLWTYDTSTPRDPQITDTGSGGTGTLTQGHIIVLRIRVQSGYTCSNLTFHPMLSAGTTAYPYVPYGHVGLWARGRNLVRSYVTNSYTYNGITWEYVSEGMIKASGSTGSGSSSGQWKTFDLGVLPAGTYTVTMTPVSGTISGTGLAVSYRTGADASVAGGVLGVSSGGKVTATLTTDGVRHYWLQPYVRENSTASNLVLAMQVQVGAASPFQPYEQTVTPIDLDGHELRSLPDGTRDELTVDSRGHAVLVQRVQLTTQAVTDGVTGTVGVDVMSSTGAIANGATVLYKLATPVTIDLGYVAAVPLCGPDLTAQAIPTASMQLTYERDLNATLARLESAIATLM